MCNDGTYLKIKVWYHSCVYKCVIGAVRNKVVVFGKQKTTVLINKIHILNQKICKNNKFSNGVLFTTTYKLIHDDDNNNNT